MAAEHWKLSKEGFFPRALRGLTALLDFRLLVS